MRTAVKWGKVTTASQLGYTVSGLCPIDAGYFSLLLLSPVIGTCSRLVFPNTSRDIGEGEARVLR
jgi:hypothetical protein